MWIQVSDDEGEVKGMINLDNFDLIEIGGAHGQNYFKITVTQGETTTDYYIGGSDRRSLNRYLDAGR